MELLDASDALPAFTRRILITGASGAGKSTLRLRISTALDLPTVEIDALHHGPNWTVRPDFEADVDHFTSGPAWVTEWQYAAVRPLMLRRADLLIWLDHGRWTVMQRVVRRTLRRRIRREQLWNGNREPPLRTIFSDPDHIIRWAWRSHPVRSMEARAVADSPDGPLVVRLSGQADVETWLHGPLADLAARRGR